MFDPQGHQMIRNRKKHLFVSSGRKGIAPQAVERIVPRTKNVYRYILVGNVRMFLAALIIPGFVLR